MLNIKPLSLIPNNITKKLRFEEIAVKKPLFVFLFLLPVLAVSQDNVYVAPDVNIISVTPVQGSGLSIDRVPGKIQTLSRDKIDKKKNFSIIWMLFY